jgi:hypothetical protein
MWKSLDYGIVSWNPNNILYWSFFCSRCIDTFHVVTLNDKGGMVHYASQFTEPLSKIGTVSIVVPENIQGDFVNDVNVMKIAIPTRYFSLSTLNFYLLETVGKVHILMYFNL